MITEKRAEGIEIRMSVQEALQTIERLTIAVNRTLKIKMISTAAQHTVLREAGKDSPSVLFMFVSGQ